MVSNGWFNGKKQFSRYDTIYNFKSHFDYSYGACGQGRIKGTVGLRLFTREGPNFANQATKSNKNT